MMHLALAYCMIEGSVSGKPFREKSSEVGVDPSFCGGMSLDREALVCRYG